MADVVVVEAERGRKSTVAVGGVGWSVRREVAGVMDSVAAAGWRRLGVPS